MRGEETVFFVDDGWWWWFFLFGEETHCPLSLFEDLSGGSEGELAWSGRLGKVDR